ncbi:MAG: UDP-N-acetylglucosamine 2-epimerase [Phycisphaerales bacterium]|nr:UDP-N-acetylglucosamine 2-epimerase [Phycisphaerales bacterium]
MAKARSTKRNPPARARKRVLIVTGSRSEFGLLRPVMDAVKKHRGLELLVVVAGEHLLKPALTVREVEKAYRVAARVPMQRAGDRGRVDHAAATARGMQGFASAFKKLKPDWVVVLGDRIEAFAAASAASIAGIAVCHIHGGDRAEGIADEAMRHAITKMSHLHCAATKLSAERIVKMGERAENVHVTGSPAIDGLDKIRPMGDREARRFGDPRIIMLLHPSGLTSITAYVPSNLDSMFVAASIDSSRIPRARGLVAMPSATPSLSEGTFAFFSYMATTVLGDEPPLGSCRNLGLTPSGGNGPRGLYLHPNHDPGREQILEKWRSISRYTGWPVLEHLPRRTFIAMLKRMALKRRGMLMGNSSAGLVECAALGVPALNLGPRQDGRERSRNVVDGDPMHTRDIVRAIRRADALAGKLIPSSLFGDGRAGPRIAALLSKTDPHDPALLRKRNSY